MKTSKNIIAGMALFSGLLAFTASASADWGHRRNDFRRDRQELSAARHELRSDIRRGAGRGEIARDRAAIARERRDIGKIDESGETIVGTTTITDAVMVGGMADGGITDNLGILSLRT